jgi:N-carbamoyl-L-amino-acid hydrolase
MDSTINLTRLRENLRALAAIGRDEADGGLYRMAFTAADMEGKRWLLERMEEAGLETRTDGAGNVIGLWRGADPTLPVMVVGSHIDTVPCAGTLDGALGVLSGLEAMHALRDDGFAPERGMELIAFSDEEGRFGGMFGSQAFAGMVTPETLDTAADLDGVKLADAMKECGMDPWLALEARRDPATVAGYLELHIEQGPVLDAAGESLGVVEAITGLFKWSVTMRGEANHAGTTPMEMRRDAFMGLADFAHEVPRIIDEVGGGHSRATIGKVGLHPGSPNTVPGAATFSLDVRDTDEAVLDELPLAFRRALSAIARRRGLMFEFQEESRILPVRCDVRLAGLLADGAEGLGFSHRRMPSGAAHDAQIVATVAPVAMVFVASRAGRSHSPAEWSSWDDIHAGARLLRHALENLCGADTRRMLEKRND